MVKLTFVETGLVWAGGGVFVLALGFCAYAYAFPWGQPAAFDASAMAVDTLLFTLFAFHHSLFARDTVKRWMSHAVPEPLLRSVYVWVASLLLIATCAAWRRIGGELYRHTAVSAAVHGAAQLVGLAIIVQSVRAIDPLELAGIHEPPAMSDAVALQISGPYGWVRHPIYLGWLLLTFGAAHMTGDRLFFAAITAVYLLIAMRFEERSLQTSFGERYVEYQRLVRYRIIPYVY
jgi:protein-S-isoprenylcysteine O-methyltransferase Ste14